MLASQTSNPCKQSVELLRLKPKGDLVASSVEEERATMMKMLGTADKVVVLDLSPTQQIDSMGITLILGLFKSCQVRGISFSVEGVTPDLMRVFKLFSLTKLFAVTER